jgi:hypothetical protein
LQKDSSVNQNPFVTTSHGHPGFTPQKVGKGSGVSKSFLAFQSCKTFQVKIYQYKSESLIHPES